MRSARLPCGTSSSSISPARYSPSKTWESTCRGKEQMILRTRPACEQRGQPGGAVAGVVVDDREVAARPARAARRSARPAARRCRSRRSSRSRRRGMSATAAAALSTIFEIMESFAWSGFLEARTRGSERVPFDVALHGHPLRLGERLDVGVRAAEPRAGARRARRRRTGSTGSSLTVWSLMWTMPLCIRSDRVERRASRPW